jgi:hypothetical protein
MRALRFENVSKNAILRPRVEFRPPWYGFEADLAIAGNWVLRQPLHDG